MTGPKESSESIHLIRNEPQIWTSGFWL